MPGISDLVRISYRRDGSADLVTNSHFELQRKLQEGYPVVGWDGDIYLVLFHDTRPGKDTWWVVDCEPGKRPVAILNCTGLLDDRLFTRLAEMRDNARDLKKTVERAEAHDAKVDKERDQAAAERNREMMKDLAWSMKKDGVI